MAKDKWRMHSLLGRWHNVAYKDGKPYRSFRFYERVNQRGEIYFFADYRIGDLVSRHHKIGPTSETGPVCSKRANTKVLEMTREELAELED